MSSAAERGYTDRPALLELVPELEPRRDEITHEQTPSTTPEGVFDVTGDWQERLKWMQSHLREPYKPTMETQPTFTAHGQVVTDDQLLNYTGEFPFHPTTSIINIVEGGFGAFKRTSRGLRHAHAERGEASITYDQLRADKRSNRERLSNPQQAHVDAAEAILFDIATNQDFQAQIPNRDEYDFWSFWLSLHSMAGLRGIQVARNHPANSQHGIRVVGLTEFETTGKKTISRPTDLMSPRGVQNVARGIGELGSYVLGGGIDITPKNFGRVLHYYGRNPVRSVGEISSCLRQENFDDTETVRRNGALIIFIAGGYDFVVGRYRHIEPLVDAFHIVDAGHLLVQDKPNLAAETAIKARKALEIQRAA